LLYANTLTSDAQAQLDSKATTTALALKADQATTYTKTEVNTSLALKANQSTTYTKTETDTLLSYKADGVQVVTWLSGKAGLSTVDGKASSYNPSFSGQISLDSAYCIRYDVTSSYGACHTHPIAHNFYVQTGNLRGTTTPLLTIGAQGVTANSANITNELKVGKYVKSKPVLLQATHQTTVTYVALNPLHFTSFLDTYGTWNNTTCKFYMPC
jgi:hypothetical protein